MTTVDQKITDVVAQARSLFGFGEVAEGRDFGLVSIIYFIGWVFIAYLLIYFLAVIVGPALFGTQPWGRPYYARHMGFPHHHAHAGPFARSGVPPREMMMDPAMTQLTAQVTKATSRK